jgi:hypothetical protein
MPDWVRFVVFLGLSIPLSGAVTFHQDVEPILQKHCQSCHRPGEIGPMPLLTYSQARPWAKAIREAVSLRKMPPWFADPKYGSFANDPSLSPQDIQAIEAWANSGATEGAKTGAPPPVRWPEGWNISKPDVVVSPPSPFVISARADVEYQYFIFPEKFGGDRWVQGVEIRPGDRSVVHHAVLYIREPGDEWLRDAPRAAFFEAPKGNTIAHQHISQTKADILAIYTPGSAATMWPAGMGKKIPAGSELVLQVHYTSKPVEAHDKTRIGIVFASEAPAQRVITLQMGRDDIDIPPGEKDYSLSVSGTMPRDALLLSLFPHMHLRGSAFDYEIVGANGYLETLLRVKPYDFFWQLTYQLKTPRLLRAGTRLRWTGTFDNSPNNPRNPDPSAEVIWGEQSRDEMMIGFFDVAVDANIDKRQLFVRSR